MSTHHAINYVEIPSTDLEASKDFLGKLFGWSFQDYGPEYIAFVDAGLDGGMYLSDKTSRTAGGAAIIIIYSAKPEQTLEQVKQLGGTIIQDMFSFPGGRRFHFADPGGSEWAVWGEE